MALDYSEKRNFFRMHMDCDMEYTVNGSGNKLCGTLDTLSGDGISFFAKEAVADGTEIKVSIAPENGITPPLNATIQVLRCEADGDRYKIAGNITQRS